ncbi:MAG: tRNA 4-thiouridine(8) synthase ThiI [Chloroflexia bacterium]|nr:tRNA 4-thiouridine(8) synthase ThiI [Chloroflexia bacterium]
MNTNIQAIGLMSGGLDSILALYLMLEQGLAVEALHALLPVHETGQLDWIQQVCQRAGVPLYVANLEAPFFELLRHPQHGYGSGMNPCLDCRILVLRAAAERRRELGAAFVFSGEVVGERPMSQNRRALDLVERRSGLQGRLLRPLSARLLPPTIPEQEGLVDRERLYGISGRSRKEQLALAETYGLRDFPTPAGGCRLTDPNFARRARDLLQHQPNFTSNDFCLLQVGRHFRLAPQIKVISGRHQAENLRLTELAQEGDLLFEVRGGVGSPVTLLRGPANPAAITAAAAITARYSDAPGPQVEVYYGAPYPQLERTMQVAPAEEAWLEQLRI